MYSNKLYRKIVDTTIQVGEVKGTEVTVLFR